MVSKHGFGLALALGLIPTTRTQTHAFAQGRDKPTISYVMLSVEARRQIPADRHIQPCVIDLPPKWGA